MQVVDQASHLLPTSVRCLMYFFTRVQTSQDAAKRTRLALVAKLTCVAHYSVVKEPRHSTLGARVAAHTREVGRNCTHP